MLTYIIRRLIQALIVLILITGAIFFAMRMLPGDPVRMYITSTAQQQYSEEEIQTIRHKFGLDKPLVVQYFDWIKGVVRGDLGTSILQRRPVSKEIFRRLPITAHVGGLAFVLGIIVGVPIGIVTAVRRGKWADNLLTLFAYIGITIPIFWLGLLLMYFFGLYLEWLPVMGYTSPFDDFWLSTRQLIMPVICLATFPVASTARQTRSSLLEVMQQDYIRTAWSKGLRERMVIYKHALKNGLIPVVTLIGLGVPMIIGGAVLVETVFNIPGMGVLAVNSVFNEDYPYVQGIALIVSIAVLLSNLFVDLAYGWLDPRVRYD